MPFTWDKLRNSREAVRKTRTEKAVTPCLVLLVRPRGT